MKIVDLKQGTPAWHAHRLAHFNASDAPAMMGCSPYETRDELVRRLATGITPEVSPQLQSVYNAGHRAEKLARPVAERIMGEELFPVTAVSDDGPYSASMDGITMGEDKAFEHKSLNNVLRGVLVQGNDSAELLPLLYRVQMEHQNLVCDTVQRTLFMASKWDDQGNLVEERHCWYEPDLALRAAIVEGWKKLEQDVAAYVHTDHTPAPKVEPKAKDAKLPALRIEVRGEVLASNVEDLRALAVGRIALVKTELVTDQDFVDAKVDAAWLREVAATMKAGLQQVRDGMETVDALMTMLEQVHALSERKAIDLENLVTSESKRRKDDVVIKAQGDLDEHIKKHNAALGAMYLQRVVGPLALAAKGLKTIDSTTAKVGAALTAEKSKADALALAFTRNRAHLKQGDVDWFNLFPDFATVGSKEQEDFQAIAKQRIDRANEAAETARKAREAAEAAAAAPAPVADPAPAPVATGGYRRSGPAPAEQTITQDLQGLPATVVVAAAVEDDGSRIKLGDINARIAPLSIDAAGLATLGWVHVGTDKSAKLFREIDLPQILATIQGHVQKAFRVAADEAAKASGLPF